MSFGLLFTICVIVLAVLAFFIGYKWRDKLNPLQKTVIVVGVLAIAFFAADTFKSDDENMTAHLTHDPKSLILAHIYQDSSDYNGRVGPLVLQMAINNTTKHSLTIKSVELQYDDLSGQNYTQPPIYIWTGTVTNRPTILLQNKLGYHFYMEDWYNISDQIEQGKLLEPGGILGGSAFYLLPTSIVAEVHNYKHFRIVIADFAGHTSNNPITLLDTMPVPSLYNKINPF